MTILCVTPNVAIDRLLSVPSLAAGSVVRARSSQVSCGGKGVNVARALRRLGQRVRCAGLLGGEAGCRAADGARREGLNAAWTWIAGETRTCIIVVDDRGAATVINEPGPVLEAGDWEHFTDDVRAAAEAGCAAVAICGSLPPAAPTGAMARLVIAASGDGRPVWVDIGGESLADALCAGPAGVKINAEEAAAFFGSPVTTIADVLRAARTLRLRGASQAIVTAAAAGAVLATAEGTWLARPPELAPVNVVASGDAFLAGLLAGFADGLDPPGALRRAAAAGAANTQSLGLADIDAVVVERLAARTVIEQLGGID